MKKSSIYDFYKDIAKTIYLGDWEVPLSFDNPDKECSAVRSRVGLMDVSNTGKIRIEGPDALNLLQYLSTNDVSKIKNGQIQYNLMCNHEGGIIEDFLLYRFDDYSFLMTTNSNNTSKVIQWLHEFKTNLTYIYDQTDDYAMVALQGPEAERALLTFTGYPLNLLKRLHFTHTLINNIPVIISRTGFTGEDGFEVIISNKDAEKVWNELLQCTSPVGLMAMELLRVEAGFCLYGREINEQTNPYEVGLERTIHWEKNDFVGRSSLLRIRSTVQKKLIGLIVMDKRVPKYQSKVFSSGNCIGRITSAVYSPSLNQVIALASVDQFNEGNYEIELNRKMVQAFFVELPFSKNEIGEVK